MFKTNNKNICNQNKNSITYKNYLYGKALFQLQILRSGKNLTDDPSLVNSTLYWKFNMNFIPKKGVRDQSFPNLGNDEGILDVLAFLL